jgi:hypothetical protein
MVAWPSGYGAFSPLSFLLVYINLDIAQYAQAEQLIFLAGSIFSLAHHQRLLVPTDTPIVLPKKLQVRTYLFGLLILK